MSTLASMATRKIRRPTTKRGGPIFLTEWMDEKGVSDSDLAKALGVSRETVWKWQAYPTRLNPLKQAQVALKLGIWPGQLWAHPKAKGMRMLTVFLEGDVMEDQLGKPVD